MRTIKLILICILTFVFMLPVFAGDGAWTSSRDPQRIPQNPGEVLLFQCTVDSLDTLTSDEFNLRKYAHAYWGTAYDAATSDSVYFLPNRNRQPFKIQYQWTSTLNKPRITAYVDGTIDGGTNWVRVDTIATNDTLETLRRADLDLNNQKYPLYRVVIYGIAGAGALFDNLSDVTAIIRWYCYQIPGQ